MPTSRDLLAVLRETGFAYLELPKAHGRAVHDVGTRLIEIVRPLGNSTPSDSEGTRQSGSAPEQRNGFLFSHIDTLNLG
jgi:hypothetical protein